MAPIQKVAKVGFYLSGVTSSVTPECALLLTKTRSWQCKHVLSSFGHLPICIYLNGSKTFGVVK